ncbi:MAG: Chase2 sensor protein, partial [Cyanobacteria bacterium P01_E01_bin.43]
MKQRVLLTLGPGNWQQGFASVTLQRWEADRITPIQFSGSLPAAPRLDQIFRQWRSLYVALYGNRGIWRKASTTPFATSRSVNDFPIDIDEDDVTHVSAAEFDQLGQALRQRLNHWLEASAFRPIDRQLRT